jgi:hypothetical protein
LVNEDEVNVLLFVPALFPSTFHWYAGVVPPLVGVAVKVNELPEHVGFDPDVRAMDTEGVTFAFTVTVIAFDVAVVGLAQASLDVITQVTTCPLVNDEVVNVELFVPAFDPSTFHW